MAILPSNNVKSALEWFESLRNYGRKYSPKGWFMPNIPNTQQGMQLGLNMYLSALSEHAAMPMRDAKKISNIQDKIQMLRKGLSRF